MAEELEDLENQEFDKHFEIITRDKPHLQTEKFKDYLRRSQEGLRKKEELYGEDEPYDVQHDEKDNEEEQ